MERKRCKGGEKSKGDKGENWAGWSDFLLLYLLCALYLLCLVYCLYLTHMSILIDETTRVVVQGLTGREGSFHAQQMIEYGTKIVAGVTPGKGGTRHLDVPVFNTLAEAVRETGPHASVIFVPRHSRPTPSSRRPTRGCRWSSASRRA